MLRKAALLGIAAFALATSSAAAAPRGAGLITEDWDCGDFGNPVTIVHARGGSGWAGEDHYLHTSLSVYEGDELVFTQSYGAKRGFGGPITCSISEGGSTVVVTVAKVP